MQQSWKKKLGILSPKSVPVEINGITHKCYPMSGKMLGRLRPVVSEVSGSISEFLSAVSKGDAGTCERQIHDGEDVSIETISDPLSPDMVDKRIETRRSSIRAFIDTALSDDTQCVAAELIMDCFREVFERTSDGNPVNWPSPEEYVNDTDIFIILEMLRGVAEANKRIFDPFMDSLKPVLDKAKGVIMKEMEEEDTTQETSGTPSNTPMDGSLVEETTEA